jgi:hypothetical protein
MKVSDMSNRFCSICFPRMTNFMTKVRNSAKNGCLLNSLCFKYNNIKLLPNVSCLLCFLIKNNKQNQCHPRKRSRVRGRGRGRGQIRSHAHHLFVAGPNHWRMTETPALSLNRLLTTPIGPCPSRTFRPRRFCSEVAKSSHR